MECPKCHTGDNLKKVSVIAASGTGFATTDLSQLLAPPKEPRKSIWRGGATCVIIFLISLLIFIGFPFVVLILPLLIGFTIPTDITPGFENSNSFVFIVTCCPVVIYILLVIGGFFLARNLAKKANIKFVADHILWESAMGKWNHLYFCTKDGIVIDEETNISFDPNQMPKYIFQI